jgi:hypothetical protein
MAFIYTALNTDWINNPRLETLVARVYANGVDVYPASLIGEDFIPPHKLRGCTKFQWEFDHERDGTYVKIDGATTDTYQVDESAVSNSGDYRCIITIGETDAECGDVATDVRTIAIIDCGDTSYIYFNGSGGAGSRAINFVYPHFILQDQIVVTPPDWITSSEPTCDLSTGTCTETLSLVAESVIEGGRANRARNGWVDIQIGSFVCIIGVQQDFIRTQIGGLLTNEDNNPAIGPTLTLSTLGGQRIVSQNGVIIITATSNVIGPNGPLITDSGFTWADPTGNFSSFTPPSTLYGVSTQTAIVDTTTEGEKTVTFAVTVNNFTVSESITIIVDAAVGEEEAGSVSGDTYGQVQAREEWGIIFGQFIADANSFYNPSLATASGSFSVDSGKATIDVEINDGRGLFKDNPFSGKAEMIFTITGPGIAGGSFTRDLPVTPEAVDPNPVAYGDPGWRMEWLYPTRVSINPSEITGTPSGELIPGNYSWSLDLHRVAGEPGDGSINDTGVILRQPGPNPPRQEGIPDINGNFAFAPYLYNPGGYMNVLPVGGFEYDLSNLNLNF